MERKRTGVSTVIGTLIFLLILMMGLTTIITIFGYYNNYNGQLLQYDHSVQQREQTSLEISGLSFGATANTIRTSTASLAAYIPITITNSQSSATPATLQEMIVFNPSSYSTYEASNLGNVRFCLDSTCNTQLFAWLESCTPSCTTAATSATVWVKLTSSISASGGTLTIYMIFQATSTNFDDNYWGEAPSLSGTYGQYDNGASVFAAYFNGNTATSSFSVYAGLAVAQATGVAGPGGATINTIQVSGTSGAHVPAFVFNTVLSNVGTIAETSFAFAGDTADGTGITGLMNAVTASGTNNGISMGMGFSSEYFFQAYDIAGAVTIPANGAGAVPAAGTWLYGSVTYPGTSATSWSAYDAPQLYSSAGGYTNTVANNPLSGATHLYIGAIGGSAAVSIYFNWNRARFYPPNGVLPTTSFGALVTGAGTATSYSFQHKLIYSQGLWWAFYSDGTNIGYSTSPDGSVWSSESILTSSADSTDGYNFNIWVSGSTFYYVLDAAKQSASFFWRYGTLQSTGTINWAISQTSVSTTNTANSYDSIVTDSSGNVWVALNTNDGTNAHIEVWKYSSGSWAKQDDVSPLVSDITPNLVPLSNGIALIYGEGGVTAAVKIITTTTGASWTSSVSPTSNYMLFSSSATAIGNTLYFVGLASGSTGVTTGTVNFWSFANGASTTSAETQLQSTNSGWLTSISQEPSDTLIVFYGSGTTLSTLYSTNFGTSWSSIQTVSSSETSIAGLSSTFGGSGAVWTSGSSSPFNVRFASIPVITTVNASPVAVHLISLYIYNTVSATLTHYDTNSSASGVSGSFDFELAPSEQLSVPLTSFSWTTNQYYLITLATDQGVLESSAIASPS